MFPVKKNQGSMASLVNPEISSKITSKKIFHQDKQVIYQPTRTESRTSQILPKLKQPHTISKQKDTESKFSDNKKQQKNKAVYFYFNQQKQLSIAMTKYQYNRVQFLNKPFNQLLSYDIMKIIECFSEIQNNFQEVFQSIHKDLMSFLFVMTTNQVMAKYGIKQGQLYKKVVQDIDVIATKRLKQMYEKVQDITNQKQEIQLQFSRQRQVWMEKQKKLLKQLEILTKTSNKQYTAYLKDKVKQQQDRIEELEHSQRELIKIRDQNEKQIKKHEKDIQEQLEEILKLRAIVFDLKTAKEETDHVMIKLRDRFDQLALKMIGIKEIIQAVQEENDSLKTERTSLIKRAAVTFQDLTPRPKYGKLVNFGQKQSQRKLKSTQELFQLLVEKLGSQTIEEKFREQLFEDKISNKRQMHIKLQHADKLRQKTLESIVKSKQQLKTMTRVTNINVNY